MSVWSITFTGVIAVFLVLWILAEIVNVIGKLIPRDTAQPEGALQTRRAQSPPAQPTSSARPSDSAQMDTVIISSLMKHRGVVGTLQIKRID